MLTPISRRFISVRTAYLNGDSGMKSFVFDSKMPRVVFDEISVLPRELSRLTYKRVLLIASPRQKQQFELIKELLGDLLSEVFEQAKVHVPADVVEQALTIATEAKVDCCVALGGGSAIGTGKALALKMRLPLIAIPGTYSGSEMTPIWGMTEDGVKTTGRDNVVLPRLVIYDPALTTSMPARLSASSGMNSLAHVVEALYAENINPLLSNIAAQAIGYLGHSLPRIVSNPMDLKAREEALYGAWLSGFTLASAGMALHHKLCHTLGGSLNLPHADTHSVMLPHTIAYNYAAVPEAMAIVERELKVEHAAQGLFDLLCSLGISNSLQSLGVNAEDLDHIADLTVQNPYYNPRELTRSGVRRVLEDAYHGNRPSRAA